ncbi:MAG: hypothetical protein MUF12_07790 [Sediminibacterium sp.]|nr:hypothetical protein [Sediminibacterium sp.]
MEQQKQWRRLNGTMIQQSIEDEVRQALIKEKEAANTIKVCIGTDSQVKGRTTDFFCTKFRVGKGNLHRLGLVYENHSLRVAMNGHCRCECCCSVPELPAGAVGASASVSKTDPPDVLDRQKCLAALAEQRRTKWFQVRLCLRFSVSSKPSSFDTLNFM